MRMKIVRLKRHMPHRAHAYGFKQNMDFSIIYRFRIFAILPPDLVFAWNGTHSDCGFTQNVCN